MIKRIRKNNMKKIIAIGGAYSKFSVKSIDKEIIKLSKKNPILI
jgi:hypothetical protein